jgi:hypothetical protein
VIMATSAPLRRSDHINAAWCLLLSAERRLKIGGFHLTTDMPKAEAFTCPPAPYLTAPKIAAGDAKREWELAAPGYLLAPRYREHSERVVTSIHEAAHFVMAEAHLRPGTVLSAFVDGSGNGRMRWVASFRDNLPEHRVSAAISHAGAMAELAISGQSWTTPVRHYHSDDWDRARAALAGTASETGEHAVSQIYALQIICIYWARIREVAQALHDVGRYTAVVPKERG